ncbi:MAG: hypothetical protein GTN62_01825 [Gemmatimonadales bacterium]|nr:hypothetical protein [Gemmatimonadales bacterium]NIN12302.1 hypothetical protein [Gemmatimonadales bacterium]NIN48840.1 hypothetical protein [Gemmatimonadales bacterium]NIP06304.1 hypothetical protein [Gemmatimonadales bacterium]NIR00676.1 hypothetical protein [Gemmatimonadales bacterium]
MKGGCFRNIFAMVGCFTVLLVAGILAWEYRGQITGAFRSVISLGGEGTAPEPMVGVPSSGALRSAERKEEAIARRGGPGYVYLSADEIAALIEDRLDPVARAGMDSIRVMLGEDRFTFEGQVRLDVFSPDLLGPLIELLGSRQPMRVAGEVKFREAGVVAWTCDEFVIASFPFPQSAIPRLVNRLTGGTDGAFLIPIPETVGDVRVRPDGVTFYRKVV